MEKKDKNLEYHLNKVYEIAELALSYVICLSQSATGKMTVQSWNHFMLFVTKLRWLGIYQ